MSDIILLLVLHTAFNTQQRQKVYFFDYFLTKTKLLNLALVTI